MPLYEYSCQDCGSTFEKLVRLFEQQPALECPACQSENTQKTISTISASRGGRETSAPISSSCSPKGRFT